MVDSTSKCDTFKKHLLWIIETKVKSTSKYIDKFQKTPRKTPISSMNLL